MSIVAGFGVQHRTRSATDRAGRPRSAACAGCSRGSLTRNCRRTSGSERVIA
jgi:hypothetical protein